MKSNPLIVTICVTALLAGATPAYAQENASSNASAPAAGVQQSAKAQRAEDRKLAKQVRRTLAKLKGIDSVKVVVFAKNGAVTLTGSVPDAGQIAPVVDAVRNVSGVASVRNALTIKAVGQ